MTTSRFDRFKDAGWFEYLKDRDVIVGGAGGIGSFVNFFLSRLGCNIYIYDMDLFEAHNMSGQLVRGKDIGKSKTDVAIEIVKDFSNHSRIEALGEYTEESEFNPIMISCFDNMLARKNMFNNWVKGLTDENKSEAIFIDGRLLAEQYQIFCVRGEDLEAIEAYKKHLFNDSEVEDVECTYKQTTHCAAGIASHMIGFLTNFALGNYSAVPFYYEYITNVNVTIEHNVQSISAIGQE